MKQIFLSISLVAAIICAAIVTSNKPDLEKVCAPIYVETIGVYHINSFEVVFEAGCETEIYLNDKLVLTDMDENDIAEIFYVKEEIAVRTINGSYHLLLTDN